MWHVKTTIMKLELKHLIYQNYRPLRVLIGGSTIDLITEIDFENKLVSFLNSGNRLLKDGLFKLILHPVSDLTKEIEVNSERFVPVNVLNKMVYEFDNINISFVWCDNILGSYLAWQANNDKTNRPVPYCVYEKLLGWHFDIYGLIDAGLAVDINTLK